MDLPWSEEYMLRQSYPLYDSFCREEESDNDNDYEADRADDAWAEKGLE